MPSLLRQMGGKQKTGKFTSEGREVIKLPDGGYETERTITIEADDGYINIPTIYGGRDVTPNEAVDIMRNNNWIDPDTGKKAPIFDSLEKAETAARARSKSLNKELEKLGLSP